MFLFLQAELAGVTLPPQDLPSPSLCSEPPREGARLGMLPWIPRVDSQQQWGPREKRLAYAEQRKGARPRPSALPGLSLIHISEPTRRGI